MVFKPAETERRQKVYVEMESERQITAKNQPFKIGASGKGMLDDDTYNLMEQLEIESKSLWRIKHDYKKDASADYESRHLWNLIEKDKEEVVRLLTEKVRARL
jgi:hypothetical protein